MKQGEIEAIYILETGAFFEFKAKSPHENFITLKWAQGEGEEDLLVDFVYFGHFKNKVIYHSIDIEANAEAM